jgi:D-alanyl-D-alanine carboxypeptidase
MLRTDKDIFGLKTGYLEEAGQCLIAGSQINGNQIVSIVLGAIDNNLRFVETRQLIDWARTSYQW